MTEHPAVVLTARRLAAAPAATKTSVPPPAGIPAPASGPAVRRVELAAIVVGVGYLAIGRPFAYLFLGELALLVAALRPDTRTAYRQAVHQLRTGGRLHVLAVVSAAFLVYGAVELVRGLAIGYSPFFAVKNMPFTYYVVALWFGLWLGQRSPGLLPRLLHIFAVVNAVYGSLAVLVLVRQQVTLPGTDVVLIAATTSSVAIIGLLCYPLPANRRSLQLGLIGVNALVMLSYQARAEWLGFIAGMLIWAVLSRRIRTLATGAAAAAGLLLFIALAGVVVPGAPGRGGTLSFAGIVGRSLAPFAPDVAAKFVPDGDSLHAYEGTASWRTTWWHGIWQSSQDNISNFAFGHGYGYELQRLGTNVGTTTRTPHNVFFYALGYTGWFGVLLFFLLWVVIARHLWTAYRMTGNPFGLSFAAVTFGLALFGNWFETPFGAGPTYLVIGLALAFSRPDFSAVLQRRGPARPHRPVAPPPVSSP